MDEPTANQFIASLVKTMQALCNGYVNFSSSIEVIGHIHLNIDRKVKLDYVLTEEVSKSVSEEDATLFSSHTYHSKPPPELTPPEPAAVSESASVSNGSSASTSSTSSSTTNRRRKSHHVPRVDDLESFSFSTVPQVASHSQANSLTSVEAAETSERVNVSHSDNIVFSDDSTSLQNTETESRLAQTTVASSSQFQNRRRKSSTGVFLTSAKHRRTSDVDSKPDEANIFEMIHIKQEPEDDSMMYHSSSEVASEQDLMPSPDFSTAVMERLDHVGHKELALFRAAGQGPQMHHQPYPIMLHTGVESAASAVSLPGPSTSLAAMPSTSAVKTEEASAGVAEVRTGQASVQTPYTAACIHYKKRGRKPKKKTKGPPPVEKTNYCEYTTEDMDEAIELVHGGMGVIDAALKYGIPRATLFNRSREGCKTHTGRCSEVYLRTHVGKDFPKKRVKSQYTAASVERAIEDVHNGMPVIDAAILYDIPRATLFIRSSKGCPTHEGRCATVSTNGKLKRTKVSRYRYLKLMQRKSTGKSPDEDELSESPPAATSSSMTVDEVSPVSAGFSKKMKWQFSDQGNARRDLQDEEDYDDDEDDDDDDEDVDVEQSVSSVKSDEMGSTEPVMGMSTTETVFQTGSSQPALQTETLGSSDQLFETLSGTIVVKIERDVDDE